MTQSSFRHSQLCRQIPKPLLLPNSTGALTIPGAPIYRRRLPLPTCHRSFFSNVRFEQAQYCLTLAPRRRSLPTCLDPNKPPCRSVSSSNPQKINPVATSIAPLNTEEEAAASALPSLAVASHLWICLFVSRTSISRSIFQIALCRPPRCLTVVSRIFVIPQECPPAKSHGFSVLTRICIATCTSTWFCREPPRIRTWGSPHRDSCPPRRH